MLSKLIIFLTVFYLPVSSAGSRNYCTRVLSGAQKTIKIESLSPHEFKSLFSELAKRHSLIEYSGNRGFVGGAYIQKGSWYLQFKKMGTKAGVEDVVVKAPHLGNFQTIRLLGFFEHVPEKRLALLTKDVSEVLDAMRLPQEELRLIKKHSKGIVTFDNFLATSKLRGKTVMLLGNDSALYRRLAKERNFEVFETLYTKYYDMGWIEDSGKPWDADTGPVERVTDDFMVSVTSSYRAVFLLPTDLNKQNKIYGRNCPGYTYVEWQWLLDNPEQMKNVTFVVGAEDSFVPGESSLFNTSSDAKDFIARDRELGQLLRDAKPFLLQ